MKIIETRYYHIKGTVTADGAGIGRVTDNYVKAEVYYDEGGYSLFTYKQNPRAYWMSVHKVGRGKDACGYWESTTIFGGGYKSLIKEVGRQSKKAEAEALTHFNANIDDYVRQAFPELELELETKEGVA